MNMPCFKVLSYQHAIFQCYPGSMIFAEQLRHFMTQKLFAQAACGSLEEEGSGWDVLDPPLQEFQKLINLQQNILGTFRIE